MRYLISLVSILVAFSANAECIRTGSDIVDQGNAQCRYEQSVQQASQQASQQIPMQFVPVLMYHQVDENKDIGPEIIRANRFREQMKFLKDEGYTTITIDELTEFITGKIKLPKKSVAITFDDGWRSVLVAEKILNEHNLKATFYILSGVFNDPINYLTEKEIIHLSKNRNFEIGAHSHTHFMEWIKDLSKMDTRMMVGEVTMSKVILERIIKKPVTSFAWPFGYTRTDVLEYASRIGFKSIVTINSNYLNTKETPVMEISRINIDGHCTPVHLKRMLETGKLENCNDEKIKGLVE